MNLLPYDGPIAFLTRLAATAVMLLALVYGGWILWKMAHPVPERPKAA